MARPEKEKILNQHKILLEWSAPLRVYRKHSKTDYYLVIFLSLTLITFFSITRQYMLIATTIALDFLTFVMWSVSPDMVTHKISSQGIYSIDKLYEWKDLKSYWFSVVDKVYVLNIDTTQRFPARLIVLVGKEQDADKVHHTLQTRLKYRASKNQNFIEINLDGKYVPIQETKTDQSFSTLNHGALETPAKSKSHK